MEVKKRMLRSKRKFIIAASFLVVALAGIGITFAVHNDWTIYNNSITASSQSDSFTELVCEETDWMPGTECQKEATYTNNGENKMLVRMSYEEFWKNANNTSILPLTHSVAGVDTPYAEVRLQNQADWELKNDGWYYYKNPVLPNQTTSSLLRAVYLNDDFNLGSDNNTCTETATGMVCNNDGDDVYGGAHYHVYVVFQTCSIVESGDDCFGPVDDILYNITVNPNGGQFNGSTATYTDKLRKGTTVDISNIARAGYDFRDWTKNGTDGFAGNSVTMNEDITLIANWVSQAAVNYTVTVDPNGGEYDGTTSTSSYSVRANDYFTIGDATYTGFLIDHWENADTGATMSNPFIVNDDITIKAIWTPIVARNERTGKLYPSITSAQAEVKRNFADNSIACEDRGNVDPCDTVTLLVDTNEEVVNDNKKYILNLDGHTVTGSITNNANGDIVLLNGEINNPNGTAVTNYGHFTMGINDYDNNDAALIDNNYVRIIGKEVGFDQKGQLSYYDGIVEGVRAMTGGAQRSPLYHDTFDERDVWYRPVITSYNEGTSSYYQHAELAAIDTAVSKTTVNGEIYYYNLQDNIKDSEKSGYKIYAIRDFPASYKLEVGKNASSPYKTVDLDLCGWNITFANTTTIYSGARFNIEDSQCDTHHAGLISTQMAITNTGTLGLKNVTIQSVSTNDLVTNRGAIYMENSTLFTAANSYVVNVSTGYTTSINMDSSSTIRTTSTSKAAIQGGFSSTKANLTINGGNVIGSTAINGFFNPLNLNDTVVTTTDRAIVNGNGGVTNMNDAIAYKQYTLCTTNSTNTIVSSPTLTMSGESNVTIYLICYAPATLVASDNLTMEDNSSLTATSSYTGSYSTPVVVGFTALTTSTSSTLYETVAVMKDHSTISMVNMPITVKGGNAYKFTMQDNARIELSSKVAATGILIEDRFLEGEIKGGSIDVSCVGTSACTATGVSGITNVSGGSIRGATAGFSGAPRMTGGEIFGSTTGLAGVSKTIYCNGYSLCSSYPQITGGSVTGGQYGISTSTATFVGEDDGTISITSPSITGEVKAVTGQYINWYDGILKAGVATHDMQDIIRIPDGATIHTETNDDIISSWLVANDENYLRVGATEYNSLTDAVAAAGSNGTIVVIKDHESNTHMPTIASGTSITIDLNGHTIKYSDVLRNNGTLTVTDNSQNKDGVFSHIDSFTTATIENAGTFNLEAGTLYNANRVISNTSFDSSVVNLNGGKVTSPNIGIYLNTSTAYTTSNPVTYAGATINMNNDAVIEMTGTGTTYAIYSQLSTQQGVITMNDNSSIIANKTAGASYGFYASLKTSYPYGLNSTITMNDNSAITINKSNSTDSTVAYGVYNAGVNMTGNSSITVSNNAAAAGGIYTTSTNTGLAISVGNGSTITASSNSGTATGVQTASNSYYTAGTPISINGTVTATSTSMTATGVSVYGGSVSTSYGSIAATGASAYGISGNVGVTTTGSTITATATSGTTAYGAYLSSGGVTMTGGTITSNGYGIYSSASNNANVTNTIYTGMVSGGVSGIYKGTTTLGQDDGNISIYVPEIVGTSSYGVENGIINFYDGVIKGGTNAYNDGTSIQSIPDGASYYSQRFGDLEHCWLVIAQDYLEVNGDTFNALDDAYTAAADGDTVKVIADAVVITTLPTNPAGKTIYFDLNGHHLTYNHTLPNAGTMIIIDDSTSHNGSISNPGGVTIENTGTLTIANGTVSGANTIKNDGSTFNMTGGEIIGVATAITDATTPTGTVDISGGTISATECTTVIAASTVSLNGSASVAGTGSGCTAVSGDLTMSGNSLITVNGNGTGASIPNQFTASGNSSIVINGNGTGVKPKQSGGRGTVTLSDNASIIINGIGTGVLNCNTTMNDSSSITVSGSIATTTGYGIWLNHGNSVTMNGGSISVENVSGVGYGIYSTETTSNVAINIVSGDISASTAGIYRNSSSRHVTVTLGSNDGTMTKTSPVITGGQYGIYTTYDSSIAMYDGTIKGGVSAYLYDDDLMTVASGYTIYLDQETIGGVQYDVRYLVPEDYVAQIGQAKYTSLKSAIAAASTGDTIELLANITQTEALSIASSKNFTLDMMGKNIYTGYTITNAGNVVITNSDTTNDSKFSIHKYDASSSNYQNWDYKYCIKNTGTLEINGALIESIYGISNTGTLVLDGTNITAESAFGQSSPVGLTVQNNGTATVRNNSEFYGDLYGFYNNGTLTVSDSSFASSKNNGINKSGSYSFYQPRDSYPRATVSDSSFDGHVYASQYFDADGMDVDGHFATGDYYPAFYGVYLWGTLTNSTIDYITEGIISENNMGAALRQTGALSSLTLDSTSVSATSLMCASNRNYTFAGAHVYSGLTIKNGSSITARLTDTQRTDMKCQAVGIYAQWGDLTDFDDSTVTVSSTSKAHGVYVEGGTATISSGTINVSATGDSYGIYNDGYNNGDTTALKAGTINVTGKNAYGAYINSGTVTFGVPEPSDSPDYGGEHADVSTTDPDVRAIGTTSGIGVKNVDGSNTFNYYDGKITANTAALPEEPTNVEYLYQVIQATDGSGYKYTYLKWIRPENRGGH